MSNFDLHEFNILSKRHNYFMTNNRINGFPVLNESSVFLQKILSQRASNSSEKIKTIKNKSYKNNFELSRNNSNIRIFKSPNITPNYINTFQDNNNEYIKPKNYRKINDNIISPERNINIMTLKNRLNTPTYYKVPINLTNRLSKSPDLKGTFDIQNRLNDEVKVLNFGGKKIFTTNSFNGLSNCNINNNNNNTVVKNRNSELFRNYNELKKKKEEIFRRKMKRDSSTNGQELLKNQKDKEIKQQKININSINDNKLRIIPLKKKLLINSKSQSKLNTNNNKKESHNVIVLQKSKNLYSKKKFKTNNIFFSKNIKNNKNIINNNNNQVNQRIKENLEYFRKKNKINNNNNINIYSPETLKHKKFVEDYNPNISQIIYSNDRKISIKMNVLKDKNETFEKKEKNINKKNKIFEINKVISIFYKCAKKNCLENNNNNILTNKKIIKRKKNMNMNRDILCSIKEEEEKIKNENIITKNDKEEKNEIKNNDKKEKEKERPNSTFGIGVRSKYLSRFHKK